MQHFLILASSKDARVTPQGNQRLARESQGEEKTRKGGGTQTQKNSCHRIQKSHTFRSTLHRDLTKFLRAETTHATTNTCTQQKKKVSLPDGNPINPSRRPYRRLIPRFSAHCLSLRACLGSSIALAPASSTLRRTNDFLPRVRSSSQTTPVMPSASSMACTQQTLREGWGMG